MKNRNDEVMVAVTVERFKQHIVQAVWPALGRAALDSNVVDQRHVRSVIGFLRENAVQRLKDAFTFSTDRWMAQAMVRFYSRLGPSVPNTIAGTWESTIGLGPKADARDFSAPIRLLDASLHLAWDHRLEHTTDHRYTVPLSEAVMVTKGAKELFWRRIADLTRGLQNYDAAFKATINGDEWALGKWFVDGGVSQCDEELALAGRRMAFAQGGYIFHNLLSSDAPNSELWKKLLVHNATMVLGSQLLFGGGGIFEGPSNILKLCEFWLEQAYLGQLVHGIPRPITVRMDDGSSVKGELEFMKNRSAIEGVCIGTSKPGGDVVLRASFERPIGRNGITRLTGGEEVIGAVSVGNEDQQVRVVKGEKPLSDTLYIHGGSNSHPVGEFGLYRVLTGTYIPRTWDADFWNGHALLNGFSTFSNLTGSTASIMTGGAAASGLAACPLTI